MLSEEELIEAINNQYRLLNDIVDEHHYQRVRDFINGMEVALK